MKRTTLHFRRSTGILAMLLCAAGISAAGAAEYRSGDLLFVAYQPHGRELVVDLGPLAAFTSALAPVRVPQVRTTDLEGVFGSPLPELKMTVVAASGTDGYVSPLGDGIFARAGSAIGAASQIQVLGSNLVSLARPVEGNPSAGRFEFGDPGSYQSTLDARNPGSLGDNVPVNVESDFTGAALRVPVYRVQFNPFAGGAASRSQLGVLEIDPQGTLTYRPLTRTPVRGSADPQTLDRTAHQGGGSS